MPVIAIVAIVVAAGFILMAVLGIVAAIAIPSYLKYQVKARQPEAQSNTARWAAGWWPVDRSAS